MFDLEEHQSRKWLLFIVASLLLHFGLGFFFYEIQTPKHGEGIIPPKQEVVFVRPEDILPQVPVPPRQALELADIAKPKVQKAPKKARFAAQYNSSVKEETVARRTPKNARVDVEESEKPKRSPVKKKPPKRSRELAALTPADQVPEPQAKEPSSAATDLPELGKKTVSLEDLQLKPSDFKELMPKSPSDEKAAKKKSKSSKEFSSLPPGTTGPGDRFVHDFMPNVKIGDQTYLNAHAFPDVQYFTRLKRVFRLRFNPRDPLVAHFRANRVVAGKVNVTMAMEVGPSGQLTKLFVVKSSGIIGYDREALRTVRESSPFNAPPKKILGKDGVLRMTWHFTTYI